MLILANGVSASSGPILVTFDMEDVNINQKSADEGADGLDDVMNNI